MIQSKQLHLQIKVGINYYEYHKEALSIYLIKFHTILILFTSLLDQMPKYSL